MARRCSRNDVGTNALPTGLNLPLAGRIHAGDVIDPLGTIQITAVPYLTKGQRVLAWGGPGRPIEVIAGEKWAPYNPGSKLTPAFLGDISGHSTFSRASATVLRLFTGSDYFGFSTLIPANFGRVEPGIPAVPTTIRYQSFSDAAHEAGRSRLLGGIHFADDNLVGQRVGRVIGRQALAKAQRYFDGHWDLPQAAASETLGVPDDNED